MTELDPGADEGLSATRLRPSEWRTGARRRESPSGGAKLLPWVLALFAVLVAAALLLVPGLPAGLQQRAGMAVSPASDPAIEALKARVSELESAQRPPSLSPPAPTAPEAVAPPVPALPAPGAFPDEVRRLDAAQQALERRVDTLVADLDAAGATSGAAAMAVGQARDFALLAAVRRHLETGRPLGRLEPLLARQFEARDQAAVAALVAWSRAPVSIPLLADRLDALGRPAAGEATGSGAGFWARLWGQLGGLVEVRQDGVIDSRAREQAMDALARGDLASALAIVDKTPPAAGRAVWLADARRLLAARDVLDRLELGLLEAPVMQPAPPPALALPPAAGAPPG